MNNVERKFAILSVRVVMNQVGIVAAINRFVSRYEANMVQLHGRVLANFGAVDAIIDSAADDFERIIMDAPRLLHGMLPQIIEVSREDAEAAVSSVGGIRYDMDVRVADAPGRAAELEVPMAYLGVNVIEVEGKVCGGEYRGKYELILPNTAAMRQMRQLVQELQYLKRWMIDFRISDNNDNRQRVSPRAGRNGDEDGDDDRIRHDLAVRDNYL
jgi:hypothetical protein